MATKQKFSVNFNVDGAAFEPQNAEIARILRELADKVEGDTSEELIRIKDANGNRVGFATLESCEVPDA